MTVSVKETMQAIEDAKVDVIKDFDEALAPLGVHVYDFSPNKTYIILTLHYNKKLEIKAHMAKLADARDLKSFSCKTMRVRVPLWARRKYGARHYSGVT